MIFRGNAHLLGNHINTDYIISSRRKRDTLEAKELAKYIFEDIDPDFAARIKPGDFIVAGQNFGCGSAMEIAALVIREAGIPVVIAQSFSRTFYRNGINSGLLLLEANLTRLDNRAELTIEVLDEATRVTENLSGAVYNCESVTGQLVDIFKAGGLVGYMLKNKGFRHV